jgi:hypothetical protein
MTTGLLIRHGVFIFTTLFFSTAVIYSHIPVVFDTTKNRIFPVISKKKRKKICKIKFSCTFAFGFTDV